MVTKSMDSTYHPYHDLPRQDESPCLTSMFSLDSFRSLCYLSFYVWRWNVTSTRKSFRDSAHRSYETNFWTMLCSILISAGGMELMGVLQGRSKQRARRRKMVPEPDGHMNTVGIVRPSNNS